MNTHHARGALRSLLLPILLLASPVPASAIEETEAIACMRTKVYDGYADGWGVRTMTDTRLEVGQTRNYLVTLYYGNTYKFVGCGAAGVANLDVLLYDTRGNVVVRDTTSDREPTLEYTPAATGSYYVVLYLRGLEGEKKDADIAMAVVYK